MNSRTVHIVLSFFVVLASLVTSSHVHAQTQSGAHPTSNESGTAQVSQPTQSPSTPEVYAQLPLLSSEVGNPEEPEPKVVAKKTDSIKTASTPNPTIKPESTMSPTPTKAAEVSATPTAKPAVSSL